MAFEGLRSRVLRGLGFRVWGGLAPQRRGPDHERAK